MKRLIYRPDTPQKIVELSPCSPAEVQTYLQLCLEISAALPAHNVLAFPYDCTINPYAIFYQWLSQANFQVYPQLTKPELRGLRQLADLSIKDLRIQGADSTKIFQPGVEIGPPKATPINPFLLNFSKIYTIHQILDSLHVYNFFLENYIHESYRLRTLIRADIEHLKKSWGQRWHHVIVKRNYAGHNYNFWVRSFLLHEGLDDGSTLFAQYMTHTFQRHYFQQRHPILKPAHRVNALAEFLENQKLATELKHYRYYYFLYPTPSEQNFFHRLRNEHRDDSMYRELMSAGSEKLETAMQLAGRMSQHILRLLEHHTTHG